MHSDTLPKGYAWEIIQKIALKPGETCVWTIEDRKITCRGDQLDQGHVDSVSGRSRLKIWPRTFPSDFCPLGGGGCVTTLSVSRLSVSDGRIYDDELERILDGSGRGLNDVLYRYLPVGTEDNH
jgi:hypothetical protein